MWYGVEHYQARKKDFPVLTEHIRATISEAVDLAVGFCKKELGDECFDIPYRSSTSAMAELQVRAYVAESLSECLTELLQEARLAENNEYEIFNRPDVLSKKDLI